MSDDNEYEVSEDDILPIKLSPAEIAAIEKDNKRFKRSRFYLTQRIVDRAQSKESEYSLPHKIPGFWLRVRPSGHKSFVQFCTPRNASKSKRLVIGDAKLMPLQEAEERAYKIRQNIRAYGHPDGEEYTRKKWTMGQLFKLFMQDHGRHLSDNWRKQCEQLYHDYVEPEFGKKLIGEVSRGDLIRCIKASGTISVQRHVRCVMSSMYTWAHHLEYVTEHILRGTKLGKVQSRDRVLSDVELAAVYNASFQLTSPFGEYGRFLALSGQRRSEVANMTWDELDLEQKLWTLPAHRSKNRHSHTIPLTDTLIALLNTLPRTSKYVFESSINKGHPFNCFSKMNTHWRKKTWVKNWRLHDLRRTLASGMAEIGIAPHVIEAVLNHRTGVVSGIAAVYNRYKYEKEKREALMQWQAHLATVAEKHRDYIPPEAMPLSEAERVQL